MKTHGVSRFGAIALLICAQATSAVAVTFTHDSFISFADLSDDGQDIVVTNCTLTVDGVHAFNSLKILNGAKLTHYPFPYGPQQLTVGVSDEAHVLSHTIPAVLNKPNIEPGTIIVMDSSASTTYAENVDYTVTLSNSFALLTLTTNSAIPEGASVLVDYDWSESFQGFSLTISQDAQIAAGGVIDVSGKGYSGGIGFGNGAGASAVTNYPFTFTAGGGGAHGGAGGMSSTFARGGASYDSTTNPAALGSGGGVGSSDGGGGGGGLAQFFIGGNFQIDGQILANGFRGTNMHSGGGAGGGILISATSLSGAGIISANGGSGDTPNGGGGGGGRIAIYFNTNDFTGNILAAGGPGAMAGGAGTIYMRSLSNSAGQLFIVNGGKRGTNTTFSGTINSLSISGGAVVQAPISAVNVTNLFIGSNSWLLAADNAPLTVFVNGNATLETSGAIKADSKPVSGFGTGQNFCGAGSGGGYGGYGGASACGSPGGVVYGSVTQPLDFGSPGAGGSCRAGSAVNMTVTGTLSLDGDISANGGPALTAMSGGGSGGSVLISAGTLTGAGNVSAIGGSASNAVSGGGGGGRIAVYFNSNSFTGDFAAHGGAGAQAGGPGTIYLTTNNTAIPQLIVDNGGLPGKTALSRPIANQYDLTITGGAVVTNGLPSVLLRNLFIGSNSWFAQPLEPTSLSVSLSASNAVIQPGGGIIADGAAGGSFLGAGQSSGGVGGGGGNSGYGGKGYTNVLGGVGTDLIALPSNPGGIGGRGSGPGGAGGGALYLNFYDTLQLDGQISVNGAPGANSNSGGGAGGSIRLAAKNFLGTGTISANGGAGNNLGGGGGGGGISISSASNLFSGDITAFGGAGFNFGGAGVIYVASTDQKTTAQIIIDNGGNLGANTSLANSSGVISLPDLTIANGSVVSNSFLEFPNLRNLQVGPDSVFQIGSALGQTLTASNITVLANGWINANGVNTVGPSPGQTLNGTGGGGGNAGVGGMSQLGALGGNALPTSITQPTTIGSRGGGGFNGVVGGNGGGFLRMTAAGTFRVDGRISADGAPGTAINSGGGSGGSLILTAGLLAGNGTVSASGGAGNFGGGGGGGGNIAISYGTNSFTGVFAAHGGAGANYGGAGFVYITRLPDIFFPPGVPAELIVDNGGAQGAPTPLLTPVQGSFNLTVSGGAFLSNSTPFILQNLFIGSNSTWETLSPTLIAIGTSNATIQATGRLLADGASSSGPSPGQTFNNSGGGGGHGGYGGASISNAPGGNVTSDPINDPNSVGSRGGFQGGNGGGSLQISVRGTFQLDGEISANGVMSSNANSGGGSGGAIFLSVGKFLGSGSISANGGAGNHSGGGGGGGRIAVWYSLNQFAGAYSAHGGSGGHYGGAGTIYLTSSFVGQGNSSQLIVDNGGARGTNTLISGVAGVVDFNIGSGASAVISGSALSLNSLTISSNGSLGLAPLSPAGQITFATLTVNSNLTIQPGGSISLDGEGYPANSGPGHGTAGGNIGIGGGAGHGGSGGAGDSLTAIGGGGYGSINEPQEPGSGGGVFGTPSGSAGGAALHLIVNRILTVDGTISVNGTAGTVSGAGGGSGGALWLSAQTFAGSGRISADGGEGEYFGGGGGGAGGRIAALFTTNNFTGTFSAHGGFGPLLAGGAGTIYLKTNLFNVGQLILDNGGEPGTNSLLSGIISTVTLSISNGAWGTSSGQLTVKDLNIGADSLLTLNAGVASPTGPPSSITVNVHGNAQVDAGGAIDVSGNEYHAPIVAGAGSVDSYGYGSGGGYGGAGGASLFGAPGGLTYGSAMQPLDPGSAGGCTPPLAGYSEGGGAIHLIVSGRLVVDGTIFANGDDGIIDGSGGGAGGSIWIEAQLLRGLGSITANGGMGESDEGGGGGGGRIALSVNTNLFTGSILASGGGGANPGQDGTIYFLTNHLISGNVKDKNGAGVSGLTVQPSGLPPVLTDSSGFYSIMVPPVWTGNVTPNANGMSVPGNRTYMALSSNAPNQNFLVALPGDFNLNAAKPDGANMNLNWYGINGVTYQAYYSTDLVNWLPYGPAFVGSNAPVVLNPPATNTTFMFFRLGVSY